jgi:folylpolyglutamate synthase/dihydrofolate synthase
LKLRDGTCFLLIMIDLTLDRVHTLANLLPPYTRPTCHITGTNGKGSVSAVLSSIFAASSLTVGRFNSPHLVSPEDCIIIHGEPVDASSYQSARSIVESTNEEHAIGASSFELLTMTALLIFEAAHLDIVVIEVGMGGRLDATNIIPDSAILVSALTAVDLDHTALLGTTVRQIAREKAGIARAGKVLVVGKQKWADVIDAAKLVVESNGGEVLQAGEQAVVKRDWDVSIDGPRPPALSLTHAPPPQPVRIAIGCFPDHVNTLLHLQGEHQLSNLGVAATVISVILSHPSCASLTARNKITPKSVASGIRSASWLGRLSWHTLSLPSHPTSKLNLLVDGAHNAASAESLSAYISSLIHTSPGTPLPITYILSLSKAPQKSPVDTLVPLLNVGTDVSIAFVEFSSVEGMPWVKCVELNELRDAIREITPDAEVWSPAEGLSVAREQMNEQLTAALEWAAGKGGERLVVVAGSLYLVADFYRLLRKDLDRDGAVSSVVSTSTSAPDA